DVISLCGDKFSVLSGDDYFTYPLLCIGGHGIISVVSNVAPADMAAMYDAFAAGDVKKAQDIHFKMTPLIDALFIETNPTPVKKALALMGMIEEDVRLPLYKMSEANVEKLKKAMKNYGLIK
ncbi:MAG: dihydrodipicolinate synthase family protein, partial [Syntrophales bacterium]|nr:dihydrodipicolinate synthase family protein [Syntrophales bacterium]